ncbi:lysophospholipid acyltransferase family protein [Candidatus Uabimicrobium sp. HlEnr_7]|uniref:lysophospholipid acyltransferase family protein n=1 Tax=Candidatus Uabimicrobium helgolandensis TaxID=3095367 RepID=UPI0035582CE3
MEDYKKMSKKRSLWKRTTKKIKRKLRKFLLFIGKYTLPFIYMTYCRFVWLTSKVQDGTEDIEEYCHSQNKPGTFIAVLWHQDVFLVSYAFRRFGGHTIASRGDAGEIVTRMLKKCNFTVFRGGSSKGKKRRKKILEEFIDYLEPKDKFSVGITVDGSSGPIYRMKTGAIVMGKRLGAPMFCVRIWCKRKFLLPTWDRTMIPLPFNDIRVFTKGPYYASPELEDSQKFDEFHHFLENELLQTAHDSFKYYEKEVDDKLLKGFPPGWKPNTKIPPLD